jgi:hypothetical protein
MAMNWNCIYYLSDKSFKTEGGLWFIFWFCSELWIFQIVGIEESELEYMMAKENVIIALIYLKRTGDALDKYRPWCKFDQEHSYFTRCFQQRRVHC